MDAAYLPIELCELIIDLVEPHNFDDFAIYYNTSMRYRSLRAYALTCSAWLPRSRHNLYRYIRFTKMAQVDSFIDTITTTPFLADLAQVLRIRLRKKIYLPFAQTFLVKSLHNLRILLFNYEGSFAWNTAYPQNYHTLIARYPITTLILEGGDRSLPDVLRLIWSMPTLLTLRLDLDINVKGKSPLPAGGIVSPVLCAMRREKVCTQLTTLHFGVRIFLTRIG